MVATVVLVVGFTTCGVVSALGMKMAAFRLPGFIVGGVFLLLIIGAVLQARRSVAASIQGPAPGGSIRGFLGMIWHLLATVCLLMLFVAAVMRGNLTGEDTLGAGIGSLVVIALLPVADSGVCRGLGQVLGGRTREVRAVRRNADTKISMAAFGAKADAPDSPLRWPFAAKRRQSVTDQS